MAVILVFFFWPAGAGAATSRCSSRTPSAPRPSSSACENFRALCQRRDLPGVVLDHRDLLGRWSPCIGLAIALLLAVMADRVVRGARVYKTLLIWPYAVAPAVAGVLWLFMFAPSVGIVSYALRAARHRVEPPAQRRPRDGADRDGRGLEADLLQLPVLPRRAAVDPEVADRGRGDRRRPALAALLDDRRSRCCRRRPSSCW